MAANKLTTQNIVQGKSYHKQALTHHSPTLPNPWPCVYTHEEFMPNSMCYTNIYRNHLCTPL